MSNIKTYEWKNFFHEVEDEVQVCEDKHVEFKHLSPWIHCDGFAFRHVDHARPSEITGRVCFIEKTPRVRKDFIENFWISGYKSSGYGMEDPDAVRWCDLMLYKMGYEVVETKENMILVAELTIPDELNEYVNLELLRISTGSEESSVYKAG